MKILKYLMLVLLLVLPGLAAAAEPPQPGLVEAMMNRTDQKQVIAMIQKGADINAADDKGRTPLMAAALVGYADVAKLLLDKGADANAAMNDGGTVLMTAVIGGSPAITRLVLEHGAKLQVPNHKGLDALTLATFFTMPEFIARYGLHSSATEPERMAIFKLLLEKGADPNILLPQDTTLLLILAFSNGKTEALALLLEHGAKVDATGSEKITPLMAAAHRGNAEQVRLLLKHGASRTAKSEEGMIALDYAKQANHADIVKLLGD